MAKMFEELQIWQKARELVKTIYKFSLSAPFKKDYSLSDQTRRSSVSVMSNIAEGFERGSNTEFIQFLYIAKGSAGEVRTQLYIAWAGIAIDQFLRSSGSISANIAEGFGRRQGKEYLHYLIVARGSTTETLNWLIKCVDIGWMTQEKFKVMESTIEEILKMLNKMIGQKMTC